MLVTRQREPEQNHWSISQLETILHKASNRSRMSNNYEAPLSTQSDWPGQYSSFLPPADASIFSQPYEHVDHSTEHSDPQVQTRSAAASNNPLDIENMKSETVSLGSPLSHRRSLDPLGLRQPKVASPIQEKAEEHGEQYSQKPAESVPDESLASTETRGMSLSSNPLSAVSSTGQTSSDIPGGHQERDVLAAIKDEDEEVLEEEEEEMMEGEGEGSVPSPPQTAAERTAQRRKMKRFRLTHQQTRFLMSEFSKQAHPDAAHRERLSRQIPGLSPRQVQVWFQNRRAKIKRLTADDRDRMIKMRAVPDGFDNVQALHSPYGAVHGLGTPLTSPVDFGSPAYADQMMRPLMVDARRSEDEDPLSPTGLSPAFGSIAFGPSTSLNNPDILSPLSTVAGDRYAYPNHMSSSLSSGPRTSNLYARPPTLDTSMSLHSHHGRHQIRPLQPLQLRDTMTRSRSDSLQSPLRTSMSWKGDAIDYTTYQGGSQSPQMGGRQTSGYSQDSMSGHSTSALGGYDPSTYSSASTVQSPTHMDYTNFQSSSMQNPQNRSRLRAASASLPLGLDLRNQFRSVGSGHGIQSTAHSPGARTSSSSQIGGASSSYSSYPSAPLTAPTDFLARTPGFRSSGADYSMPQMSAPIAPSNDFAQAFQSIAGSSSRISVRDAFGGAPLSMAQSQTSGERSDDYSQGRMGVKRKPSFTGSTSATSTGQSSYGNTS